MWRSVLVLGCVAACNFGGGGHGDDGVDARPVVDGAPRDGGADAAALDHVDHLPAAVEALLISSAAWSPSADVTIDTEHAMITPAPPPTVVVLADVAQDDPSAPHVMVIQAASMAFAGKVDVVGTLPLVLVANTSVTFSQAVDAGAHIMNPGPGGADPGAGRGAGVAGTTGSGRADAGGSGGAFGSAGGKGGGANGAAASEVNMQTYGAATALEGGSGGGGGSPASCGGNVLGGAGGGALQVTAYQWITVTTSITVAGGGGGRGRDCGGGDGASGGGGGSGGMIYLQAPSFLGAGEIGANGGGGGGGGAADGNPQGETGKNGSVQLGGGPGAGATPDRTGGTGGSQTAAGGDSDDISGPDENGGGGGGGVGRIYARGGVAPYSASPPIVQL